MALFDPLGSPVASGFHTNNMCCDRNGYVISPLSSTCLSLSMSVMKAMQMFSDIHNLSDDISKIGQFATEIDWSLIYILLTLATTLMCTLLIVYRIFRHAPGMSASRKIIEMLIESSAMYSISLIVYLALVSQNSESSYYADIIAAYVRVRFHHNFIESRT